MIEIEKKGSKG